MAWDALTDAETAAGQAVTQSLMRKVKDNFDYLYGESGSSMILPNGSFEIDSDADDTADQWTYNTYSGGTVTRDATGGVHGDACLKITSVAGGSNGGGDAESEYVKCSDVKQFILRWVIWCSAAGMENEVKVEWFGLDKVLDSTTTVYTSTATPTVATAMSARVTPPADAHYCKVYFVGGTVDVDAAGITYYDDAHLTEGLLNIVELTTAETSTFIAPSTDLFIELSGGGGGGGASGGGGGASGGYISNQRVSAIPGESISYRVGAGGSGGTGVGAGGAGETTYFGALIVNGGPGGAGGGASGAGGVGSGYGLPSAGRSAALGYLSGGSAGAGAGADSMRYDGGTGSDGGGGAASEFGAGGNGGPASANGWGAAATSYGAGGGGGGAGGSGGAGAGGIITIKWFG